MERDREIGDEMAGDAAWAVHLIRKGWDAELDYSEASVAEIERVCASLWEYVDDEAERDVPMYTERLGAYLGEVLRRALGGMWELPSDRDCPLPPPRANADVTTHRADELPERTTPAVRCGPYTFFPHEQVRLRLTGQARAGLVAYFQQCKTAVQG